MFKGISLSLCMLFALILVTPASSLSAMSPVITNIKDIIVADDTVSTDSNRFVYPDAIDLFAVLSDGDTTDSHIIWSYRTGDSIYLINNTPPLPIGENIVLPPVANRIAGPGAFTDDPSSVDSNLFTITVRNNFLSPVGGPNQPEPTVEGIIPEMTDIAIFYGSDQDSPTSTAVMIYTENDGTDRLSPAGGDPIPVDPLLGWTGQTILAAGGTASFAETASGLCMTVSPAGDNVVAWTSPYGAIDLTDNTVYEIRAALNTTQTQEDSIPFWDIGLINLDVTGAQIGANAFGANFYFLDNLGNLNDNFGGSQGIGNFRNEFVMYWTPLAVSLPSWRSTTTGAFQAAADPFNDFQLSFRTFDIGSSSYGAQFDFGTVCLQELKIYRYDISDLTVLTTDYSDLSLAAGDVTASGPGTSFSFGGGALTISPSAADGWLASQIDIVPGTGTIDTQGGPQPAESWPLTWPSDVLYLISVQASIPHAGVQTSGIPDQFMIQLEGHVQTYQQSYILPNIKFNAQGAAGAGMPPVVPATGTYKAFGYTNESSKSSFYASLRPHISFLNMPGILPDPATGAVSIHSLTVNRVTF